MSIERRLVNPQQGALDTVLPDAVAYRAADRDILVSNVDVSNSVTVRTQAGQLVNGGLTLTVPAGQNVLFLSDGSGWRGVGLNAFTTPLEEARVFSTAAQSIPTAVATVLNFPSVRYNVGIPASSTKLTAPTTGWYLIGASVSFTASAAGNARIVYLRVNGGTFIALQSSPPIAGGATPTVLTIATEYQLTAGDYVEVLVLQDTGGALTLEASTSYSAEFWMQHIAGGSSAGVPLNRAINTTAPITGGGVLSSDLTLAITDFIASGAGHARGTVPDPGAAVGSTKFLREDATWQVPAGGAGAVTFLSVAKWGL